MDRFERLIESMQIHALKDYPREAVGIILKDYTYVPCRNLSEEPTLSFILDPGALVEHDGNIWGIFHSHPGDDNPIPSEEDKVSAAFKEYKFLVGFNNKFYIYWLNENVDALMFDKFTRDHIESQS